MGSMSDAKIFQRVIPQGNAQFNEELKNALSAEDVHLLNAVKFAKLGPWEYDATKDLFTFNDHFYELFHTNAEREGGYTMTCAQYVQRFIPAEERNEIQKNIRSAVDITDPHFSIETEHRIVYADGEIGYINVRLFIVRENEGSTVKVYGIHHDITEQKKTEEKLKQERVILRTLINNLPDAIYVKDINCRKTLTNLADMLNMNAKSEAEVLGKTDFDMYPEEVAHGFYADDQSIIRTGQSVINREEYIIDQDGQIRWILTSKLPLRDEQERVIGLVGIGRDITQRKNAEIELMKAKEKAEEMNRLKSNFLANISHELRTPLCGILGFAEMLKEETSDSFHLELIENMQYSGTRLLRTFNSLLNFSVIESGKIELNLVALNVPAAILSVIDAFSREAEKKNLKIEAGLMPEVLKVDMDENLFNQILSNLVENAIKYTSEGKILIRIDFEAKSDGHFIVIKVIDTGIGIPAEVQKYIFEPFRQASEGVARSFEGTGLGLTITKKYIEIMNGEISVESTPGKGSTFTVKFPMNNKQHTPKQNNSIQSSETRTSAEKLPKVLLVENEISNVDITKHFLKDICIIDDVNNGRDALLLLIENKYDAILMDIDLPGSMDGMEITREARKLPSYKETPIIALTAFAMKGDKDKFIAAGCSHYMPKPFKRNELRELMKSALKNRKKIEQD
jgi:PAS domain S-box-containing protein